MSASKKIAGFVLGLVMVFAAAVGVGMAIGPDRVTQAPAADGHGAHADAAPKAGLPGGLMASQDGYTLRLANSRLDTGRQVPLRFQIVDAAGRPVTQYVDSHEKPLHLIVVRRDLTGYQHVHPVLDGTGTWSVPVDLAAAGDYRVFADFTPQGGPALTLGADLAVAGTYEPRSVPAPAATAKVDDYVVELNGAVTAGEPIMLTLKVSRGGKPVTDLQPYLGAYGHLVALRTADLAYLHVHPTSTEPGPEIGFHTSFPSAGDYRLFLEFKHRDVVRAAEFTVPVAPERSKS